MSLKLKYGNVTNAQEAYQRVKGSLTPDVIAKFKVNAEMEYDDGQKVMVAKGKGFQLTLMFLEDHADVDLNLAFFLKAAKGAILSKIEKMLTSVL